ncbi:ATP-binding protein [Streptomyces sp. TRM49041]|uniref:ATP-binding protein n=1 Tax=Streptomyces sp. TRM49041 TaxID=2603216 RepID=UPI0011ECE052|nr:ATP-binding protein [Streptomyces sp. TRM49041]
MPPHPATQAHPAPDADSADQQTWTLAASATSARLARRQVGDRLRAWRLPHLVDDAELIVSELVANAIRHGSKGDPVWHTLRRLHTVTYDAVRLEVGDHGRGWSGIPAPREAGDDILCNGRGLRLVRALSSDWGAWRLPHGHVVWAVLPVDVG